MSNCHFQHRRHSFLRFDLYNQSSLSRSHAFRQSHPDDSKPVGLTVKPVETSRQQPMVTHNPVYISASKADVRNLQNDTYSSPAQNRISSQSYNNIKLTQEGVQNPSSNQPTSVDSRQGHHRTQDSIDHEIMNDPSYGALGKWSGVRLNDGLHRCCGVAIANLSTTIALVKVFDNGG